MGLKSLDCLPSCGLCNEVARSKHANSLTFLSTEHHIAVPTLGCFLPGYSLVIPRRHVTSFGLLEEEEIRSAETLVDSVRRRLSEVGLFSIVSEHGTGSDKDSAACCAHAHLHLIPIGPRQEDVFSQFQKAGGESWRGKGLRDLIRFSKTSYVMLSLAPGEIHVWTRLDKFHRQFVRYAAAYAIGLGNYYDWRRYPFLENMRATYDLMRSVAVDGLSPRFAS